MKLLGKLKHKRTSAVASKRESSQDLPSGLPPPYESIIPDKKVFKDAKQCSRRPGSVHSQSAPTSDRGSFARSSSASSTASSRSATSWTTLKAWEQSTPSASTDVDSGQISHIKRNALQITGLNFDSVLNNTTAGKAKESATHYTLPCSFCVKGTLRGQPLPPEQKSTFLHMRLVDNLAPGPAPSITAGWQEKDATFLSWYAYFNEKYSGWNLKEPDWRGQAFIDQQRRRICSDIEIYNVRYSKFRDRACVYGMSLRVKGQQ